MFQLHCVIHILLVFLIHIHVCSTHMHFTTLPFNLFSCEHYGLIDDLSEFLGKTISGCFSLPSY